MVSQKTLDFGAVPDSEWNLNFKKIKPRGFAHYAMLCNFVLLTYIDYGSVTISFHSSKSATSVRSLSPRLSHKFKMNKSFEFILGGQHNKLPAWRRSALSEWFLSHYGLDHKCQKWKMWQMQTCGQTPPEPPSISLRKIMSLIVYI